MYGRLVDGKSERKKKYVAQASTLTFIIRPSSEILTTGQTSKKRIKILNMIIMLE